MPWLTGILAILFILSPGYGALLGPVVGLPKWAGAVGAFGLWWLGFGALAAWVGWSRVHESGSTDDFGAGLMVWGGVASLALGAALAAAAILVPKLWS